MKLKKANQPKAVFFLGLEFQSSLEDQNWVRASERASVDKCVELPLSGCLIVRAKKYEATFIRTNNGVTHTHTQTTALG